MLRKALIRPKHLEIIFSNLSPHPKPKLKLESYTLDPKGASRFLHIAGNVYNDIRGRRVIDLGCGIGVLAIGAALMGAKNAVGVDIDRDCITVAKKNATKMGVEIDYICSDIEVIHDSFDTSLMNPPFGSWSRGVDIRFLKKALEISTITYSLHKSSLENRRFLYEKIYSLGGRVDRIFEFDIILPKIFKFHKEKHYRVKADLYRIKSY